MTSTGNGCRNRPGKAAIRCSWRVYAFALMSNHIHVVLKTREPNLSRGMQSFLSGYANAWSRRHRFSGHVFQGRYRTELVEDETYLWTVTRDVHLNPVLAGTVEHPAAWAWSSYPGLRSSPPPSGVGGLRRVAGVLRRCVRRVGSGRGLPAICDRGTVRTARVAVEGSAPWVDSRKRSIRRTRQGDGCAVTSPRTAQGISTIAEFTPFTSH